MKQISILFIILCAYSTTFFAQTELKRDSIAIKAEQLHPYLNSEGKVADELDAKKEFEQVSPEEMERRAAFVKLLQFKLPYIYDAPPLESTERIHNFPFENDFSHGGYQILNEEFYLTGSAYRRAYPSIGTIHSTSLMLNFEPSEWISISGGMFGAKYSMDRHQFKDIGFDASIRVKLHDRLYIRAHGRYALGITGSGAWQNNTMNMLPQTYFGAGALFKITDNLGIEGGMIREYNPATRRWKNTPYLMPVMFKIGGR